jgi:hypothetical protein
MEGLFLMTESKKKPSITHKVTSVFAIKFAMFVAFNKKFVSPNVSPSLITPNSLLILPGFFLFYFSNFFLLFLIYFCYQKL